MEQNTPREPQAIAINQQGDAHAATLMKGNHMEAHHSNNRTAHLHHQPGGIILHCEDSDCEVESNHLDESSNQLHNADHIPEVVANSIASSSGFDRHQTETLRSIHPMRHEIVGASDDICIDSEQSSVHGLIRGQTSHSPWLANNGNFSEPAKPLKVDLILPQPSIRLENNILQLEETDYTPISLGWGFSLLGFFIERFPGKDAVHNLTKRWKFPARVSFHPKGWIIFRFETEEHSQAILNGGPYQVFGIPLVLCSMPPEFRFDSSPALNFKVWASLPNLPLELWNASAISKIASTVGTPLEVDHQTISKNYIAGPRVLILVDGAKEPPSSIMLKLHNGNTFEQQILLDFYPFFCTRCRRAGHLASKCRVPERTNPGTRPPPRNRTDLNADNEGWQVVRNKKNIPNRSRSRQGRTRSKPRAASTAPPRSKSRPPKQQWQPINQAHSDAANVQRKNAGAIPNKIQNNHIRFEASPSTQPQNLMGNKGNQPELANADRENIETSNRFRPFDELEQPEDMVAESSDPRPSTTNKAAALHTNKTNKNAAHPTTATKENITGAEKNAVPDLRKNQSTNDEVLSSTEKSPRTEPEITAAHTARYIPPAARQENTVHQKVNSNDTFSTECIPVGVNDSASAAHIINNTEALEPATTPTVTNNETKDPPPSYANILTSPPNNVINAGDKQNPNKKKMDAQILDPRKAYTKKTNSLIPPTTAGAGRFLKNSTLTKNRK